MISKFLDLFKNHTLIKKNLEIKSLIGKSILINKRNQYSNYKSINDAEEKFFSQNGEDGIIDYILETLNIEDPKFIEIGANVIMSQAEINMYFKYGNRLLRQVKKSIGDNWFIDTKIVKFGNNEEFPLNLDLGGRKVSIELYNQGHSEGDLVIEDLLSKIIFVGDLVFNERAPTIPHANITNWNKYISDIKNRKWDYIVPGHGELIKIKEQLLLTKYWINYIDKTAKQAVLNGTSPAEIFNEGIPASLRKYKLAKETWIRDLPLLINKYESE